jgi:hypothetical protein
MHGTRTATLESLVEVRTRRDRTGTRVIVDARPDHQQFVRLSRYDRPAVDRLAKTSAAVDLIHVIRADRLDSGILGHGKRRDARRK